MMRKSFHFGEVIYAYEGQTDDAGSIDLAPGGAARLKESYASPADIGLPPSIVANLSETITRGDDFDVNDLRPYAMPLEQEYVRHWPVRTAHRPAPSRRWSPAGHSKQDSSKCQPAASPSYREVLSSTGIVALDSVPPAIKLNSVSGRRNAAY